jgi:hypothetical protein
MMSETESTASEEKPLSPLQLFCAKIAVVTVAILIVLYAVSFYVESFMEDRGSILKGGPAFWGTLETKLYRLADDPDLPPEKKKKIIEALRKLSAKYKPYLDAIGGDEPRNR